MWTSLKRYLPLVVVAAIRFIALLIVLLFVLSFVVTDTLLRFCFTAIVTVPLASLAYFFYKTHVIRALKFCYRLSKSLTANISILIGFFVYCTLINLNLLDKDQLSFFEELAPFALISSHGAEFFGVDFITSNYTGDTDEDMLNDQFEKTDQDLVWSGFTPNNPFSAGGKGTEDLCSWMTLGEDISKKARSETCRANILKLMETCLIVDAQYSLGDNIIDCNMVEGESYERVNQSLYHNKMY